MVLLLLQITLGTIILLMSNAPFFASQPSQQKEAEIDSNESRIAHPGRPSAGI